MYVIETLKSSIERLTGLLEALASGVTPAE